MMAPSAAPPPPRARRRQRTPLSFSPGGSPGRHRFLAAIRGQRSRAPRTGPAEVDVSADFSMKRAFHAPIKRHAPARHAGHAPAFYHDVHEERIFLPRRRAHICSFTRYGRRDAGRDASMAADDVFGSMRTCSAGEFRADARCILQATAFGRFVLFSLASAGRSSQGFELAEARHDRRHYAAIAKRCAERFAIR